MSTIPVEIIAGANAGVPVSIHKELYPLFQSMQTLAFKGNHWARLCVKELQALSSGHIKKNVYIQCNGRQEEFGEYTIILPGCSASFRKNNAGMFYIYEFKTSLDYEEGQVAAEKPGLFNVTKIQNDWSAEYLKNGLIKERKINVVTVSDQSQDIRIASQLAPESLLESNQVSSSSLASNGFDLHFTPGKNRIGGLRNLKQAYGAESDSSLHESAILLADTMENAKKIKDVTWVSERGGSGVLTQAMRILKERGINFKDTGHKAFFSKLQTNLGSAEQLARDIGIIFDGKSHSKEMVNINQVLGSGLLGGFINPIKRYIKEDKYSALNCISDIGKEVGTHKAAYGAAAGVVPAATGFYTSAATLGTTLAACTGPGLVFAAAGAVLGASVVIYKGVNTVGKSYFPLAYQKKLMGK